MIKKTTTEKIQILYEDDEVAVISKPAGIAVHGDGRSSEKTLVDWIKKNVPAAIGVGENTVYADKELEAVSAEERPGIVHRLDKDTSGVLIIAKSQESYESLKEQFQSRTISKMYIAFVEGEMKGERGVVHKAIGRSNNDARKRSTRGTPDESKDAETVWRNLKAEKGATLLALWPKTGRTHQIRVHLKSIHHPVVADALYGKPANTLGFKRLALHARNIAFQSLSGKKLTVEAPFPPDFKEALQLFGVKEDRLLK